MLRLVSFREVRASGQSHPVRATEQSHLKKKLNRKKMVFKKYLQICLFLNVIILIVCVPVDDNHTIKKRNVAIMLKKNAEKIAKVEPVKNFLNGRIFH